MSTSSAESKHQHLPRAGDTIEGKYVVEEVLGSGGMGLVVAARHVALGTRVALKFLGGVTVTNELRVRFRREAQAAASIRNEHVARVLDTGVLPDATPYMVMDLLEGHDLGVELKLRRRLPLEEAVDYLVQACDGLAEAHARGIVHRDVKPSNLFLCRKPSGPALLKVLDFGISKAEGASASEQTLTSTATILGSPSYMSPEQIRHAKGVDARADVWALGVVLHQALTGELPFRGEGTSSTLASVMVDEPPSLRALRPELPAELDDVVRRCLQKTPSFRFQTTRELAAALAPYASEKARSLVSRMPVTRADVELESTLVTHDTSPSRTLSRTDPATDTQAASVIDEPTPPPRIRRRGPYLVSGLALATVAAGLWLARDSFRARAPNEATAASPATPGAASTTIASTASGSSAADLPDEATASSAIAASATAVTVTGSSSVVGGAKAPKWSPKPAKPVHPGLVAPKASAAPAAPTPASTLKSVLDGHK